MRIKISGRHMEMADSLKAYADEKAGHLNRFYDRLQSVEIIFDQEGGKVRCEMIATADHHTTFVAKETHADAFAAFDAAIKDVERQLTRHKEKHRNRKHLTGPEAHGAED
ncbi:MAG: ribosome-associated translation inhibitor RaiA [Planctomycetes bacterium]|nr:ribosome-associated translation inhibitor RaiA [Planctomycetota bacterium]